MASPRSRSKARRAGCRLSPCSAWCTTSRCPSRLMSATSTVCSCRYSSVVGAPMRPTRTEKPVRSAVPSASRPSAARASPALQAGSTSGASGATSPPWKGWSRHTPISSPLESSNHSTPWPSGVGAPMTTPVGQGVLWFDDSKGDEIGVWRLQPFHGGETVPLAPDVQPAWSAGLALAADGRLALGTADRTGFSVRVGRIGAPTTELYRHEQTVDVADVSRDGHLLVVHHAEHGDNLHPALRAFDLDRGEAVGDLWDGRGYGLMASRFSPVAGDWRLALLHERGGMLRPALWNPVAGERTDLEVDLPGQVEVADWWPDGG